MVSHLYSLDLLYTVHTRAMTMSMWPPPGCKRLQEFNNDCDHALWYSHSIYIKLRICCTGWLRICYTGIGCGGAAGDVWANIGSTQPASNTRHDSGSSRFTLVSSMGAWTYLQVQVLDEVHLGCHSKQQASECMQTKGRRRRRLIPEWCHT